MPGMRRRYAPKRRLIRRKRLVRRKYGIKRRMPSQGGVYVKRRVPLFAVNASPTAVGVINATSSIISLGTPVASITGLPNVYDVPFSMELHLNDIEGSSELVNFADKYRIVNTVIKVSSVNGMGYGFTPMPYIEFVYDHDDSTVPSISVLNQKMGLVNKGFNQRGQLSIYAKPLPAMQVYNGLSAGYVVPRRSPFINTSNGSVPHYFIKGVIRNVTANGIATSASTFTFDMAVLTHLKDLQ